jgi:hypothetical protein
MSSYSNDTATTSIAGRGADPDLIRRDIEATRADLSRDVDALTEKVSPGRVVGRRVDRAKAAVGSVKAKVMGSGQDTASLTDAASSAPSTALRKTEGNPLAAGLIAFGVGWLASSLLPSSQREQDAATAVKDKAVEHSDTLSTPLKEAAANARENLQGPAREAVQSVKASGVDAASAVKDEASSADDTGATAQHAKHEMRDSSSY